MYVSESVSQSVSHGTDRDFTDDEDDEDDEDDKEDGEDEEDEIPKMCNSQLICFSDKTQKSWSILVIVSVTRRYGSEVSYSLTYL